MTDDIVEVTQADRELYRTLLGLHETNMRLRRAGKPIIDALQLLARHRLASEARSSSSGEVERLREHLSVIITQLDTGRGAPGHCHQTPGIWDDDASNGENAGKPCTWCAQWQRAKSAALEGKDHSNAG